MVACYLRHCRSSSRSAGAELVYAGCGDLGSDTVSKVSQMRLPDLSLTEWVVLALIVEQPTHGFAISKELAPDGDLGKIWTVRRSLVYGVIVQLEERDFITPLGAEPGNRGPVRTRMGPTRAGKAAVDQWLSTPALHVRELRTHLMLQLRLLDRRGLDLSPLASAQLEQLAPILTALRGQAATAEGFAGILATWRYESAQAAARVLEGVVAVAATPPQLGQAASGTGSTATPGGRSHLR
jgi:DNA-binding PadR family transcriptional regulator